jgi:hypothetical protein
MESQKSGVKHEETTCKVLKTDSKTWRLEISDPVDSLIAELDLKKGKFGFKYSNNPQQENSRKDSMNVDFDRQNNVLNLEYIGKDVNKSREISVKVPILDDKVFFQTREIHEIIEVPEKISTPPIIPEKNPEEQVISSNHIEEKKKISLKRKEYKPVKSSINYPIILEGLLDDKNTIKQASLFESFKSTREKIGVKAYLRCLEGKGLVVVDSDEGGIFYKFLEPTKREEITQNERKQFLKAEYPLQLEKLMKDSKIKISELDAMFTTGNERRSVKQFINYNYVVKNLAKKVEDPAGAYYQFESPTLVKTEKI